MTQTFTFLLAILTLSLSAQESWESTFIHDTYSDRINRIIEMSDGSFRAAVVSQETSSSTEFNYIAKISKTGEMVDLDTAIQSYAGWPPPYLFENSDGNLRMIGYWTHTTPHKMTRSYHNDDLDHVWEGAVEVPFAGKTLMVDDTSFVVAGRFGCEILLYKIGLSGVVHWEKTYPSEWTACTNSDPLNLDILQTPDGGYFLSAYFRLNWQNKSLLAVKTDANGDIIHSGNFSEFTSNSTPSIAYQNGYYYILQSDRLGKLDSDFNLVKFNKYSLLFNTSGYTFLDLTATNDGHLALIGYSYWVTGPSNFDIAKLKFDTNEEVKWLRNYGFNNLKEYPYFILPTLGWRNIRGRIPKFQQ